MADETAMTQATKALIDELANVMKQGRYLLLTGGSGVGKTHIAKKVAEELVKGKGAVTVVPIHRNYDYSDFVKGITFKTENGGFVNEDKIFLNMLKEARRAPNNTYVFILDDIGRGMITGILGDVLSHIEPHGSPDHDKNDPLAIPPNFYIIATRSTLIDSIEPSGYGFSRRFYHFHINSDYGYMNDDFSENTTRDILSANDMFYRTKEIVEHNLRYGGSMSEQEKEKYYIGHGVFNGRSTMHTMKYQVLPMLKQYIKEGILDRNGTESEIDSLEDKLKPDYIISTCPPPGKIRIEIPDFNGISGKDRMKAVTGENYVEGDTPSKPMPSKPIMNIVLRIKSQGLISDTDIMDNIIRNEKVLLRGEKQGIKKDIPAHLFVSAKYLNDVRGVGDNDNNYYYSEKNIEHSITINGEKYMVAGHISGKGYANPLTDYKKEGDNKWSLRHEEISIDNEKQTKLLFRILDQYYQTVINNYKGYLEKYPNNKDIRLLKEFAEAELNELFNKMDSVENSDNKSSESRNNEIKKHFSALKLLWTDTGATITDKNENTLTLKGVYKVENKNKYEEFQSAMDTLEIQQMILQGPPGTSKTHSAKEFLKYVGGELDDDGLKNCQIKNYDEWKKTGGIAWDIVQFHPSYGYEDFVRGIEVSTDERGENANKSSSIAYKTVNKILGKMAKLASENEDVDFYLIIDEINRANLATVFGELIYGLEYRKESVATPYTVGESNQITLPDNLYIIGTMNTADKSIGGIDYAIRRRFLFFSLLPEKETIEKYIPEKCPNENNQMIYNKTPVKLFEKVEKLFKNGNLSSEYYKEDVQIGHTYFLVDASKEVDKDEPYKILEMRFEHQIVPILREYYKDGLFNFTTDDSDNTFKRFKRLIQNNGEKDIGSVFEELIK